MLCLIYNFILVRQKQCKHIQKDRCSYIAFYSTVSSTYGKISKTEAHMGKQAVELKAKYIKNPPEGMTAENAGHERR